MRQKRWITVAGAALVMGAIACSGGDDTAGDAAGSTDSLDTQTPAATTPATTTDAGTTPAAQAGNLPAGVTAEMIAAGEQQFKSGVCIACHGPDATGTPNAPNLTDTEWINTDGSYEGIAGVIRTGVQAPKQHPAAMPPMGGAQLTDQQINEIAAYIYSISHKS